MPTDVSQGVGDDYVLNANQAGVIINRDSQTIRKWYKDQDFMKRYPEFVRRIKNESRGLEDVWISARILAKVARDRNLRLNMERVEQDLADRPDLIEMFREEAEGAPAKVRKMREDADDGGQHEIRRDPRDSERITELKAEVTDYKTKAEKLQEELSDEKEKRISLLAGAMVFNDYANSMIAAAKRGEIDVSHVPFLPRPSKDSEWVFPQPEPESPKPQPREEAKVITAVPTVRTRRAWIPWALSGVSLLAAGGIAAYVFLPKLLA